MIYLEYLSLDTKIKFIYTIFLHNKYTVHLYTELLFSIWSWANLDVNTSIHCNLSHPVYTVNIVLQCKES